MFSKSKTSAAKPVATRAPVTPSLISHGLTVNGDMKCEGELQIDGTVNGDIDCLRLIIGEKAVVRGEVLADSVVIRGEVQGRVRGRDISMAKTARVTGDVLHQSLSMEAGAHLEGNVRKVDDPRVEEPASMPKLLHTDGRTLRSLDNSGGTQELGDAAAAGGVTG